MVELDNAYMRDQLMLEILLDIRDLFSVAPAAKGAAPSIPWNGCADWAGGKHISCKSLALLFRSPRTRGIFPGPRPVMGP